MRSANEDHSLDARIRVEEQSLLDDFVACENCVLPGDPVEGFPPFGGPVARPARSDFFLGRLRPTKTRWARGGSTSSKAWEEFSKALAEVRRQL